MNSRFRFPCRVRIHGGECGAVARALHHEAQKESLMEHESLFLSQAESEKFFDSTLKERKQMSIKTSIKRIALVAVSALTLGSFSAVSASAAALANGAILTTVATVSAPTTATAGATVSGLFSHNGLMNGYGANIVSTQAYIVAAPTTSLLAPNSPVASALTLTQAASYTNTAGATTTYTDSNAWGNSPDYNTVAKTVITSAPAPGDTARVTAYFNVSFTPDVAGTYVITVKNQQDATQLVNWTVTVATSPVDPVLSTAVLANAGVGATISSTTLTAPKAAGVAYGDVQLTMKRVNTNAYTGTDFSAVLSGPGLISASNSTCAAGGLGTAKSTGAIALGTNGLSCIEISGDGTGGKATLSILVGSTVWKTFTINFIDTPTSFKVDTASGNTISTATGYNTTPGSIVKVLGIGLQQWWQLNALDANLVLADATPDIVITVADETVAKSVSTAGDLSNGIVKIEGVKAGTTSFTVQNATKTFTLGPVPVIVSDLKASSATFTLDKSAYAAGEAFTLTVSAKDAGGNPLADREYASMATLGTNVVVYNSTGTVLANGAVSPVFSNGSFAVKGFMPLVTGDVTFTLTLGAIGSAGVADAAAGAVLKVSAPVTSGAITAADAATDAAAEAIDAANAATDAANLAAEAADAATVAAEEARDAADAATAAVEELASQVAALFAALKAQLTTLANTVAKIAKKVKA